MQNPKRDIWSFLIGTLLSSCLVSVITGIIYLWIFMIQDICSIIIK